MQASGSQASAPTPGRHDVPTGRVPAPGTDARRSRHQSRRRWWLSGPDQAAQAQQRPGMEACVAADSIVLHRCEFRHADRQQPAVPDQLQPSLFCQDHNGHHSSITHQNPSHSAAMGYPWPVTQDPNTHLSPSQQVANNNMIRNPDAHLTGMIKDRKTLPELCSLLKKHEARLNMLHASAAITQAAQLLKRSKLCNSTNNSQLSPDLFNILLSLQLQHIHNFGARQVANSLWSLSQLWLHVKHRDDHWPCQNQQQELAVMSIFTQLIERLPVVATQLQPQELSNVWYALGCLPEVTKSNTSSLSALTLLCAASDRHWHVFQRQELCAMLWAAAKLDRQHPGLSQPAELQRWLVQLSNWVLHVVHDLSVQEQSSALWSLTQLWQCRQACVESLGCESQEVSAQPPIHIQINDSWLPTTEQYPCETQPSHDRQEQNSAQSDASQPATSSGCADGSSSSLQSTVPVSLLQCCEALFTSIAGNVQHLQAAELAQAVAAIAQLPATLQTVPMIQSLMQRASQLADGNRLGSRAAACALHAVARMHHQRHLSNDRDYSAWVASMVGTVHGNNRHSNCTATDLIQAMHALVLLRIHPSGSNAEQLLSTGQLLVESGNCTPHQLAGLLWLYAKLQLLPPPAFMAAYHRASYSLKDAMSASDIAAMFWALGRLRLRPGRKWMSDLLGNVWNRRSEFHTDQLIQILFGLGRLQYALTQHMCEKVAAELKQRCNKGVPHQQRLAILSALGSMPLIPDTVVQWVEDDLIVELLKPPESDSLPIDSLLQLLWACARLTRRLPNAGASIQQKVHLPLVQYSQPLSYVTLSLEGQLQDSFATHRSPITATQHSQHQAMSGRSSSQSCSQTLSSSNHADPSSPTQHEIRVSDAQVASMGNPTTQLFAWQPLRKQSGRLRLTPEHVHLILCQTFQQRQNLDCQQLARLMYVLPLLNIRPSRQWLNAMLFLNVELLPTFTPHSLALTLFALGCMKSRPTSEWLAGCLQQVQSFAPQLNTSMVSGVLRGLSLLDLTPGALWMAHFITQVTPVLALMPAKQLTITYQAVTNLEAQLCADWGPNFSNLLRDCQQDRALFQDPTSI